VVYGLQDLRICSWFSRPQEVRLADVYRVTEVVGVSSESWEAAARVAVETAAQNVRELRVAEVVRRDLTLQDGAVVKFSRPARYFVQVRPEQVTRNRGLATHGAMRRR
jgi:flavin-binding protein dodecin